MDQERERLDAWRAGDERAGEALCEQYFPALLRFFRNKTDRGVDDLIQSTFLSCLEGRHRFEGITSFRAYLFGIARNVLYDSYRDHMRDQRAFVAQTQSAADLGTGISTLMRRRTDQELLAQALQQIPLELQVVLELYFWESMTAREIAEALQQPEGSIRTKIRRARLRLRDRITALEGGEVAFARYQGDLDQWAQQIRAQLPADS